MKIKQVCELTGLTDRAIRFYIEEGLISPACTENYLGRRSFAFSDADAAHLLHIATLRKFGFTVEEIRQVIENPAQSRHIIGEVQARKEAIVAQETENLAALARLDGTRDYTVAELADALEAPVQTAEVPKEDRWLNWREKLLVWLKATPIWVVMLLPVLLLAAMIITAALDFRFLHVEVVWRGIAMALAPTIVLAALMLLGQSVRVRYGVKLAAALLGLLWFLPLGMIAAAFSMDFSSETDNIAHYRQVNDQFFFWHEDADRLFPAQPGEDGSYYYYCDYDSDQVLYAEWTLSPEELAAEIARAKEILSAPERYVQLQQGSFTCLIGKAWVSPDFTPFRLEERVGFHSLTMFAWDEKTGRVRYLLCDEQVSPDEPPYYMTLDWQ